MPTAAGTLPITVSPSSPSLRFLDGLRGIAALYVMIGHARWLLWEGGEAFKTHQADYSMLGKLQVYFFASFKYGHQMVLFFFLLSGFVIHLKQSIALSNQKEVMLKDYFLRRARRILPPVIFALLLTYCCDLLVQYMDGSIYHRSTPLADINRNIGFDHSLSTLAGNIFFVQQTYTPVFGSNGPMWSLKYEWWFYMFYPLLLLINKRNAVLSLGVAMLLSVLAIIGWSWGIKLVDDVFAYLFCWWLGCFSADIYAKRIKIPLWVFGLLSLFLLLIPIQAKIPINSEVIKDVLIALGFTGMLNLLLARKQKGARFTALERLKWLGDFSYTLYVIHMPLLVLANAVILKTYDNKMPQTFLFVWLMIPVIMGVSYFTHLFIEKPFVGARPRKLAIKPGVES